MKDMIEKHDHIADVEIVAVEWAVIGEYGQTLGVVTASVDPATDYTAVVYEGSRPGKPVVADRQDGFATVSEAAQHVTDHHYPKPVLRMR